MHTEEPETPRRSRVQPFFAPRCDCAPITLAARRAPRARTARASSMGFLGAGDTGRLRSLVVAGATRSGTRRGGGFAPPRAGACGACGCERTAPPIRSLTSRAARAPIELARSRLPPPPPPPPRSPPPSTPLPHPPRHHAHRISRDQELLVGGHDPRRQASSLAADGPRAAGARVGVALRIELEPEPLESRADPGAHLGRVLADP